MSNKVFLDNVEYTLNNEQYKKVKEICSQQAFLGIREISELSNCSLLIMDYQRGYRWTETEIQALLEDILNVSNGDDGYCMQPIVIKPRAHINNNCFKLNGFNNDEILSSVNVIPEGYELIDGQQRLTTLFLIHTFLNENEPYSIYYELNRNIDGHFIKKSKEIIKEWFNNKKIDPKEFEKKISKLFFIWYEVRDTNETAEKIFKNINEGKIELTNAELFKALLLNPDNYDSNNTYAEESLQVISFEWDKIESILHDDDFWFFISRDNVEQLGQCTRIDYIIEIYARYLNLDKKYSFDPNKDYFSFLVIQRYLEDSKAELDVYVVWREIVRVFNKLYSWYKDTCLYHLIGFLVASEEKKRGSKSIVSDKLFELYRFSEQSNIYDTQKRAKSFVYSTVIEPIDKGAALNIEDFSYDKKKVIKNVLLFSNIYFMVFYEKLNADNKTDMLNTEDIIRFPFRLFHQIDNYGKGWDIEHISPQTLEKSLSELKFQEYVDTIWSWYDELNDDAYIINKQDCLDKTDNYLKNKLSDGTYNTKRQDYLKKIEGYLNGKPTETDYNNADINKLWKEYAEEISQDPDDNIRNLVLLNASINREYGNAFFNKKRQIIIEHDRKGQFIPICTKNVFMKYFSNSIISPTRWTDDDMKGYGSFLDNMLKELEGWKSDE